MEKNYEVSKMGFVVTDSETQHILGVNFENDTYHGLVVMPEQGEKLPLAPWKKGENPFQDDHCFEGRQEGFSPNGNWWFSISPTSSFSKIMKEVEALNRNGGIFKIFRSLTK